MTQPPLNAERVDLEALEKVARAATPGPWRTLSDGHPSLRNVAHMVEAPDGTLLVYDQIFPKDAEFFATFDPPQVLALLSEIASLRKQLNGYQHHLRACEQVAGKALGYPWFKDDQKNFPGSTEADGVCVGEHVGDSIVEELADQYASLRKQVEELTGERDRCHARLEIDRKYRFESGEHLPVMIPLAERHGVPDGIECRNETIRLQDESNDRLRAAIAELKAEVREVIEPFAKLAKFADPLLESSGNHYVSNTHPTQWLRGQHLRDIATLHAKLGAST